MGDYNIVLEDRDSINRNTNLNEVNARIILKDLIYDINLKDCFRELIPTGGFTWQRNNSLQWFYSGMLTTQDKNIRVLRFYPLVPLLGGSTTTCKMLEVKVKQKHREREAY